MVLHTRVPGRSPPGPIPIRKRTRSVLIARPSRVACRVASDSVAPYPFSIRPESTEDVLVTRGRSCARSRKWADA
jgi:hypothetical protein